jgi:hypothetical protein
MSSGRHLFFARSNQDLSGSDRFALLLDGEIDHPAPAGQVVDASSRSMMSRRARGAGAGRACELVHLLLIAS